MANKADSLRTKLHRELPFAHPIKEHPIDKCEEFVKKLYIDMLCVIAQYENSDTEFALNFVQRIMAGADMKEPVTDHVKNAMEITEERFGEFLRQCKENKLENIFVVDAMLISCADGKPNVKQVEFITEIAEAFKLTKKHTEILSKLAICILEHDMEKYHNVHDMIDRKNRYSVIMSLIVYIKEFVVGVIIDSKELYWYYSNEKVDMTIEEFLKLNPTIKNGIKSEISDELIVENISFNNRDEKKEYMDYVRLLGFNTIQFFQCDFYFCTLDLEHFTNLFIKSCTFSGCEKRVSQFIYLSDYQDGKIVLDDVVFTDFMLNSNISQSNSNSDGCLLYVKGKTDVEVKRCLVRNYYICHDGGFLFYSGIIGWVRENAKSPSIVMTDTKIEKGLHIGYNPMYVFRNFNSDTSYYSNCIFEGNWDLDYIKEK